MEHSENKPQIEVLNEIEIIAMDIIATTPFDENANADPDDPEASIIIGPPTMAPFNVLIEEAREKGQSREQFFAIVEVIFMEYLKRCETLFMQKFKDPKPFVGWIKERVDNLKHDFYRKETPSKLDHEYEKICQMMIGNIPEFSTMIDVDIDIDGMPLQEEVLEFLDNAQNLEEEELELRRQEIKKNRPELWQAIVEYVETSGALFSVRCEVRKELESERDFEYSVKQRIEELHWQEIGQQMEDLKQQFRDLGIDADQDPTDSEKQ